MEGRFRFSTQYVLAVGRSIRDHGFEVVLEANSFSVRGLFPYELGTKLRGQ